jgi:hypothetical protein
MLSVQGGIRIQGAVNSTYFEHIPFGEVHIRPFNEIPRAGSKLHSIGRDVSPALLKNAIKAHTTEV